MDGHTIFGTPIYKSRIDEPEMNEEIVRSLIIMKEINQCTNVIGNHRGWRSDWLHARTEPCWKKLFALKARHFDAMVSSRISPGWVCEWGSISWAMVNERHDYHLLHSHPNCDWVGVYYPDVGDSDPDDKESGNLMLVDPRGSLVESNRNVMDCAELYKEMFGSNTTLVAPYTGLLFFFPSYLLHTVLPYRGNRPRLSIPTNFMLKSATKQ